MIRPRQPKFRRNDLVIFFEGASECISRPSAFGVDVTRRALAPQFRTRKWVLSKAQQKRRNGEKIRRTEKDRQSEEQKYCRESRSWSHEFSPIRDCAEAKSA